MKRKLYILIIISFIGISAFSQKKTIQIAQVNSTKDFVNQSRTTTYTDINGVITKITVDTWNTNTNVWDETLITTATLNSDGTVKEYLTKLYSTDTKTWKDNQKTEYTYESKKILTETTRLNVNGSWNVQTKATNTWNGDLLQTVLNEKYNFTNLGLVNDTRINNTYNSDGSINQSITEKWGSITKTWSNSERKTYKYTAKKLTSVLVEKYENSAWVNKSSNTLTYNADGTLNDDMESTWTGTGFLGETKETYSYNADKSLKEVLLQEWVIAAWVNKGKILFSESATTQANLVDINTEISVFPNPSSGIIHVNSAGLISKIEVFTLSGQKILAKNMDSKNADLNLTTCQSGIYILKVSSPNHTESFRITLTK